MPTPRDSVGPDGLLPVAEPRVPFVGTVLVFLFSLALFALTSSPAPVPGESARWLLQGVGLDPLPSLSHPLWFALAKAVSVLPFGPLVYRLNLLSAVCGALSVALIFLTTACLRHDKTFEESSLRRLPSGHGLISGLVAALILATSVTFWVVSNRAHPATLGICLALLAFRLFQRFDYQPEYWRLALSAFCWGLACTEVPGCVLASPVYLVAILLALVRKGVWRWKAAVAIGGALVLGLLPLLLLAFHFMGTPAYAWREFDGLLQVIYHIGVHYSQSIVRSLPRVGWLTVFLFSILPWIILFALRPLGGKQARGNVLSGSIILNVVLTGLLLLIVFDGTIAPWSVSKHRTLLVTPYVVVAMWGGYLAGYWFIILGRPNRLGQRTALSRALQAAAPALLVGAIALSGWQHARVADARSAALGARFARAVLADAQPFRYLVVGHPLDDVIRLVAHEQRADLLILSPSGSGSQGAYGRYLASLFPADSRLSSLARVGFIPLIQELVSDQSGLAGQVAVLSNPDLWAAAGHQAWPVRTLFVSAPRDLPAALPALVAQHTAFWPQWMPARPYNEDTENLVEPWVQMACAQVAKVANNVGVLLEDHDRTEDAVAAYQQARRVDPRNISALLNLHNVTRREKRPEFAGVDQELKDLIKKSPPKYSLWSLATVFGYVRSPEYFAGRGWAWAMSGKPNLGIFELQRAVRLSGGHSQAQQALGNLFLSQQRTGESEQTFRDLLVKNPENRVAILGLARIALLKRDFAAAEGYLARLEELKSDAGVIAQYRAMMAAQRGDNAGALKLLQKLVADYPDRTQIWAALAAVALDLNDTKALDAALQKLERTPRLAPEVRLGLVRIALARNNRKAARSQLDYLLLTSPGHVEALEMLLRLDVQERRHDMAERDVARLLAVDSRNALANYVLGTIQLAAQQFALAETSFVASLATERTPEALNDLAWLLGQRGAYAEAEEMVRECLALDEGHRAAWDTLGFILFKRGKLVEARTALQRALQLSPNNPEVVYHLALVLEQSGETSQAFGLANELLSRPAQFDKSQYEELRALVERVRPRT